MKQYMKLLPVLALGLAMGSCVDDAILPYSVEKPEAVSYIVSYSLCFKIIYYTQHQTTQLLLDDRASPKYP